jgi:ribonuclease HIII
MSKAPCFTAKINLQLAPKIEEDLKSQGFEISKPAYTLFSAKKPGISCTLYESGTLTVQGKDKDPFIEFYLEPEILKNFQFSHPEAHLDLRAHIGLDEAGKGDFFGPLCIAAVFADKDQIPELLKIGVKDSKQISDGPIIKLAHKIKEFVPYTVIRLFPQKYNELHAKFKNLNRLLAWAHTAALGDMVQKTGCHLAIIDQFADSHVMEQALRQKKLEIQLEQRTKGEEDLVVAAASILARAAFLEGLESLSKEYGFPLPKGAAAQVIVMGKKIVEKLGRDALEKMAITHFKTIKDVEKT